MVLRGIGTKTVMMRALLGGVFCFAVWIGMASYQSLKRTWAINEQIRALEDQASHIDQENATLKEKIEYFSSASFEEREAKEKLGLKKAGEQVVIVQSSPETEDTSVMIPTLDTGRTASFRTPNYYKWWKYIYGDQRPL